MEATLLGKTPKRKKTKAKRRTSDRPAFPYSDSEFLHRHAHLVIVFGTCYTLAVLFLFYFISVQFASGFYDSAISSTPARIIPIVAKLKEKILAPVGLPARLKIPKLKVNAVVKHVGRASNGSMGVPKLARDTAWYALGPKPGEKGSAVIAGHINWWNGTTGVFAHLADLKPGDVITVQDEKGASTSFVVRESREYGQKDDASKVFLSYDGKSHLNLVTCSGIWNKLTSSYSKRLVVFTDKVVE